MHEKLFVGKLFNIQREFQAQLLGKQSDFSKLVESTINPSVEQRISIYVDSYKFRLIEALADNYSNLKSYLGGNKFQQLAETYVELYPSRLRSIRWFGDKLPEFLQHDENYTEQPILAELARFEWALNTAFDAQDAHYLSPNDFISIPPQRWEQMTFSFHPSLSIYTFTHDIVEIWETILKDETIHPQHSSQAVIFWRHELEPVYRVIPPTEAIILNAAMNGEIFVTLCDKLKMSSIDMAASAAASLLMNWLSSHLITRVEFN